MAHNGYRRLQFTYLLLALSVSTDDEYEEAWWGNVRDISDQALVDLGIKHLDATHGTACSVLDRLEGSYNCAYIIQFTDGFKFVIRVPASGRPGRWT